MIGWLKFLSDCPNMSMMFIQDGQIDYGEFVAMMRMGNGGGGRRTMRSIINWEDAVDFLQDS